VYFCFRWLDSPFKGRKFNFDFKLGCALLTGVGWSLIIFFVYDFAQFTTGGCIQTHKLGISSLLYNQLRKYAPSFVDCVYFCFLWLDSPFKGRKFNFDFKLGCALLTGVGWSLIIFFVYVFAQFITGGWIQTHKLGITSFN
jgi:hypothetical protein